MITKRTKIQLLVFLIITLVGVTYVGAKYARLDRAIIDRSYTVTVHFPESGGIFEGAEVTYRGVRIGQVSELVLTEDKLGVDVHLEIENSFDEIPADSLAVVGNRSAVGEQYVELQPQSNGEPFLDDDSEISAENTRTPILTETLLEDVATTVQSVDRDALRTTVAELGAAFGGTGEDLQRIIDTGNSFIQTADENFELTTALIRDSNIVLNTQIDSQTGLRMFADHLSSFSTALVGADKDLRRVIDSGSLTANQLRTFLEQNEGALASLLDNSIDLGEIVVRRLPELSLLLVAYPVVLSGSFGVVDKSPETGLYDSHIGLILTQQKACTGGYASTDTRGPENRENRPLNTRAGCTEPPNGPCDHAPPGSDHQDCNVRGVQNLRTLPRPAPGTEVLLPYDSATGQIDWDNPQLVPTGNVGAPTLGEDSWKWLYLNPLMTQG